MTTPEKSREAFIDGARAMRESVIQEIILLLIRINPTGDLRIPGLKHAYQIIEATSPAGLGGGR